jgi:hypothetical protein
VVIFFSTAVRYKVILSVAYHWITFFPLHITSTTTTTTFSPFSAHSHLTFLHFHTLILIFSILFTMSKHGRSSSSEMPNDSDGPSPDKRTETFTSSKTLRNEKVVKTVLPTHPRLFREANAQQASASGSSGKIDPLNCFVEIVFLTVKIKLLLKQVRHLLECLQLLLIASLVN